MASAADTIHNWWKLYTRSDKFFLKNDNKEKYLIYLSCGIVYSFHEYLVSILCTVKDVKIIEIVLLFEELNLLRETKCNIFVSYFLLVDNKNAFL